MLPRAKNRHLAALLVILSLTSDGLSSPTTTDDPLTLLPTLPSILPPESSSSSSSSTSSSSSSLSSSSSASTSSQSSSSLELSSSLSSDNSSFDLSLNSSDSSIPSLEEDSSSANSSSPSQTPLSSTTSSSVLEPSSPEPQTLSPTSELSVEDPSSTSETHSSVPSEAPTFDNSSASSVSQSVDEPSSTPSPEFTSTTSAQLLPSNSSELSVDATSQFTTTSEAPLSSPSPSPSTSELPVISTGQPLLSSESASSSTDSNSPTSTFPPQSSSQPDEKIFEIHLPPAITEDLPQSSSQPDDRNSEIHLPPAITEDLPQLSSQPVDKNSEIHLPPANTENPPQSSSQPVDNNSEIDLPTANTENASTVSSSVDEFYNLTKEYFQWKLQSFPEFAASVGINDKNAGHLNIENSEHFEKRRLEVADFLQRSQSIDTRGLSEKDYLYYKVFVGELDSYLKNFKYMKFYMPVNDLGGVHTDLKYLVKKNTVLETYNDYLKLLSRYSEFPRKVNETITLMKGNIADGLMPSNWTLDQVPDQIDDLLVPVNESVFFEPFLNITLNITSKEQEALQRLATPMVLGINEALEKLKAFVQTDYIPAARTDISASSLPGGSDYYQACLKFHTTTDMTPQQVHDLGLSEIARIQQEVLETGEMLGLPNRTLGEISSIVKRDPKQMFSSKEDLLDTYKAAVYNDLYPLMNHIVSEIPEVNVTVEENVSGDGYASYHDPPRDGSRPGTFYINAKIYEHHRRYEVNALSLHETVPGHHLQAITIINNGKVPDFLRHVGPYNYKMIPAAFSLYTSFTEGWGLYSEYLGVELGLYEDPYQRLGRHSWESLRAARLVVDTGMHALGWSRQQAIEYLLQNTAMSRKGVENQIDRYITWPGQATAYKVGEVKIKMLREKSEQTLDYLFWLQDFHETVLACTAPLNILEECVNSYIKKALENNQQQGDTL